ncbi:zf-HC2 domain-containing protein [Stratiformator vulcanicus]|uniref:Putative zinc-finger domain-containing protein n=1 Tax=Stratiformator vulcanicus TaxID=2527980 RepID=A0A517QW95_9PLAN|nr:zf-HC2 domain-containing protein [Stratiformator vulcanicus]QDT35843.1 hypothetical protein Pan189_01960 [Stratiformator vulcanicus]
MSSGTQSAPHWEPCNRDEIGEMVSGLRRKRTVRTAARASIAAAAILIAVAVPFAAVNALRHNPLIAGIRCDEVRESLDLYIASDLSAEKSDQITAHLEKCPPCRSLFESKIGGGEPEISNALFPAERPIFAVRQPISNLSYW